MTRWMGILALAWLTFYPVYALAALQDPAADAEARLRARVEGYWSATQQSAWTKAIDFVQPSQRDFFAGFPKEPVLSYTVDRITIKEDRQHADVDITVKKSIIRLKQPVDLKVHNTWELMDGEWFITFHWEGRNLFAGSSPGGAIRNATSLQINQKPVEPSPAEAPDSNSRTINIGRDESPVEATYNFGQVFAGEPVGFRFQFRNIGAAPLKVQSVQVSDPSLSIKWLGPDGQETAQRQFQAKGQGEVGLAFNSRDHENMVERRATIQFEGRQAPLVLGLKGFVMRNFTLKPARVELGASGQASSEVTIVNETGNFINIEGMKDVPPFLDASLSKAEFAPRDLALLKISIKPGSKVPPEGYDGALLLRTNFTRQPTISVPIRIRTIR